MANKEEDLHEKLQDLRRVIELMKNYLTIHEFGKIEFSAEKIDASGSLIKSDNLTSGEKTALRNEFALGVIRGKEIFDEMQDILP